MALYSLLVLSLAVCGRAWPQLPTDDGDFGSLVTLPVIPYTTQGRVDSRRVLAEDGIPENSAALTQIPPSRRRAKVSSRRILPADNIGEGLDTLPVVPLSGVPVIGRQLPVDGDDVGAFITLPVIHSTKQGVFSRAVEIQLANRSDVAYYAQLNIGTPPQSVFAQLDTGSFELWVNPTCDALGSPSDRRFCQAIGFYDSAQSSTATLMEGSKTLRYGIGAANISYVKDSIALPGSATMAQVQFGVAISSEDQFAGILGIGFGQGITTRYRNFVDELQAQGITKTKAYSLALGGKEEEEGVLVFGGVDTAKFGGPLAKLPFIPAAQSPDGVPRFWVAMNSLSLTPPSGRARTYANTSMAVFLDSGATLTLLPAALANAIATDFGATNGVDENGFYPVACYLADLPGSVDFAFNGITIKVPYKEMIREISTNPPTCFLGIVPNSDFVLLGDTFLRSAYVVFDLDTNVTYMAAYNNCGTRTVTINQPTDLDGITGTCSVTQGSLATPSPSSTSNSGSGGAPGTAGSASDDTRSVAAKLPGIGQGSLALTLAGLVALGVLL